jgi:diguanylate cyclase
MRATNDLVRVRVRNSPARRAVWWNTSPSRRIAHLRSQPWFLPALALTGLLLVYGSWQMTRWGLPGHRKLIADLFCYPFDVAVVWTTWRASQRTANVPQLRRAWRLLSLGAFSYLLGDITFQIYDLMGIAPYPSIADGFYLAFDPLVLAGLLSFPVQRRGRGGNLRLWMDMSIVALSFSAAVGYFLLGPTLQQGGAVLQTAFSVAYPVGDMVLLVGLSAALLRGTAPSARRSLHFFAAGLACYVTSDVIYGYMTLHGGYSSGDAVDGLVALALAAFALAGAAQKQVDRAELIEPTRARVGWPLFAAVMFGFGVLMFSERNAPFYPGLLIAVVVMALAATLSVRFYLEQHDLLGAQEQLSHQALHDSLTGLANRVLLVNGLDRALARSKRLGSDVVVMLLDLDDFKLVNDSLGHAAGDELLVELARRLVTVVRTEETVSRLGGDEFGLVAEGSFNEHELTTLAYRFLSVFIEPFPVAETERQMTGSLGIAVGRAGDQETATDLLRDADTAMYRAKSNGKGRFDVFDAQLRAELVRHVELGAALERALRNGELTVVYQPIVRTEGGQLLAAEALVRWSPEHFGPVSPSEFVPLAEENGLIIPLDRFVLDEAARQLAQWRAVSPGALPLGVFVNVSLRDLALPGFSSLVAGTLAEHGLNNADIAFELTERVFIDGHDRILIQNLTELIASGTRLVVDDFGTGYSALASLKRFPLTAVKIDKFFIHGITDDDTESPITRAVVSLCQTLGMMVIAEGIETEIQHDYLRRLGCDAIQGYLPGRPQQASDISAWIAAETGLSNTEDLAQNA